MRESRDHAAADAFVLRQRAMGEHTEKIKTSTVADTHVREMMRLSFLQGWHEAMVARDGDDATDSAVGP